MWLVIDVNTMSRDVARGSPDPEAAADVYILFLLIETPARTARPFRLHPMPRPRSLEPVCDLHRNGNLNSADLTFLAMGLRRADASIL